jgi:hypothetical protein
LQRGSRRVRRRNSLPMSYRAHSVPAWIGRALVWEFDSRYASNLLQLLMDAVQAEATSTTATRAAALSGCKGPSVPLPMGEYCTSDDDKLHIVSDKAIQYGARAARRGRRYRACRWKDGPG